MDSWSIVLVTTLAYPPLPYQLHIDPVIIIIIFSTLETYVIIIIILLYKSHYII